MWGETRGRWEGLPFGKFLEQVSKFGFFCGFPPTYRFQNFGFFRGFPQFLGDPKILKIQIFLQCLGILKDGLIQKFFVVFPRWTGLKIWIFTWCPAIFRGPQKFSKRGFSALFLGILKDGLIQNFLELGLPRSFLGILKGRTHPKISEPANLSAVFLGF